MRRCGSIVMMMQLLNQRRMMLLCRPWYSFAATYPKDIIVMIDKSQSMLATYLSSGEKKLAVAIKAAQSAIESLNPNDNVSIKHIFAIIVIGQ